MTRPARVRFYVDADVLGLAKVLVTLRSDVTFPGDPGGVVHKRERPPCPIGAPSAEDVDWIPQVAALGWLIITRDANIREPSSPRSATTTPGWSTWWMPMR